MGFGACLLRSGVVAWSLLAGVLSPAAAAEALAAGGSASATALAAGLDWREAGQLSLSIDKLRQALDLATDARGRQRALAELGASLLQARQLDAAQDALVAAHASAQGVERAAIAVDLGNLALLQGLSETAAARYGEALQLGGDDAAVHFAARLNLARGADAARRLDALTPLARELDAQPESAARARWQLNLGLQAGELGEAGLALAYRELAASRRWAQAAGDAPLLAAALDALAQLYEHQRRFGDALMLTQEGLAASAALPPARAGELVVRLEWRLARLAQQLGQHDSALAAYQRAVARIEALRQDIPIVDDTGGSSFRNLLEPVYLGLVGALLDAAERAPPQGRAGPLRQVVDTIELLRQSELQDYLGDRCAVDAIKGGSATSIPRGTAVLYPVVLADRLELLVETAEGISRQRSGAPVEGLRASARRFAQDLRSGSRTLMPRARQLYDWVLRPLEPLLAAQHIDTLVVVPDASLRLVTIAAFHDGRQFAIEKFAIATATGLSMTNTTPPVRRAEGGILLAGLSTPGAVVDRLSPETVAYLLGPQEAGKVDPVTVASARAVRDLGVASAGREGADLAPGDTLRSEASRQALREALALPGVKQEIHGIGRLAAHTLLLDADFSLANFQRAVESGDYRIVHLASHGVFGGRADRSYILTHDQLLTLDGLQSLLRSDRFRRHPIELLSLSACETAEGDERAPLGISGAAIKARAQAVVGSLWPVSDDAAVRLMGRFYQGLLADGQPKARALQRAQVELLHSAGFENPFFWAPFVLIGNWL